MNNIFTVIILLFIATHVNGQNYKEEINTYREKFKNDFLTEERSPLKKEDLSFLNFFEPDESYRVVADFSRTLNAVEFDVPTMSGKTKKYIEYGKLKFKLNGKPLMLIVYQGVALLANPEYKDHLFLPFTDSTNGNLTYENGRYLDFKTGDIMENKLTIDFNKAYNPYCAYSSGYNCPKPPDANALTIGIYAGEKKFGKSH